MEKEKGVNYKGLEELEFAVRNLGMQRVLYELASIINSYPKDVVNIRNRYSSQFSHDLHHTTADDRNDRTERFK